MIFKLIPYERKRGYHHPLLACDIENNPKTGAFICSGVYGDVKYFTSIRIPGEKYPRSVIKNKRIDKYFTDRKKFLSFLSSLRKNSCMLVFFNLPYDKVYFDEIVNHKTVLSAGTRLILLKLKNNNIKAIDLMNHVEGSLEDWMNYLKMERKGIKKAKLKDHKERVMNDVKATYWLGTFIENFYYNECKIPLQITRGACSLKLFTMHFFKDWWKREGEVWGDYERKAYYGGRVEVFRRGKLKVYGYDVNSMYLSVMRDNDFPNPNSSVYVKKVPKNWMKYLKKYHGVWNVKVFCPHNIYIPVLPHHVNGKLNFPVGTFKGQWTSIELLKALECGYKINVVYDFIYYKESKNYFKGFCDFVWKKRIEYKNKGNKGMDLVMKYIGNSLYGKFAQRNDTGYWGRLEDWKGDIPEEAYFFTFKGEWYMRIAGENKPATHQFTVISAFVSSYARLKLFEALRLNELNVVYCDTDSIFLTSKLKGVKVGSGLGEWSKKAYRELEFYRPKVYGKKRKGVPKRAKLFRKEENLEIWRYKKPLREKESARRNLTPNKWVTVTKHLGLIDDKRVWGLSGERSRPLKIDENNA